MLKLFNYKHDIICIGLYGCIDRKFMNNFCSVNYTIRDILGIQWNEPIKTFRICSRLNICICKINGHIYPYNKRLSLSSIGRDLEYQKHTLKNLYEY